MGEPWEVTDARQRKYWADKDRLKYEGTLDYSLEAKMADPFVYGLKDWWGESGKRAYFEVEVKDASFEVIWEFGNDCERPIIPTGKWNVISMGTIRRLVVDDLDDSCVQIINVKCFNAHSTADLMVDNVAPAHFTERLYDQELNKGEDLVLRVGFTQSIALARWYKSTNMLGEKIEMDQE